MLTVVAGVFWTAAGVRAWRWRRNPGSPALRAIAIALLAIAIAMTLDIPYVRDLFTGGQDDPSAFNPGSIGKQIAIVVGAWACQSLLLHLTNGPAATAASERRRALMALTVGTAATAVYFARGLTSTREPDPRTGLEQPWAVEARLIVFVYAGVVLFFVARLCWQHRGGGSLARGVTVMGAGAGVMSLFAVARCVELAGGAYAEVNVRGLSHTADILQMIGLSLIAVGTLLPWVGTTARARRMQKAHDELRPLWEFVTARVPTVVFAAGEPEHRTIDWQLGRRVVEIQDGLVILAPQLRNRDGEKSAAQFARALVDLSPDQGRLVVNPTGGVDLSPPTGISETSWLREISRELGRIPTFTTAERMG